ncbi:MAG: anthranilate phosphoribosyltransferase [Mariprofundaceae bacterium]|nr:anthranilate phosphoribosyltransferase [Mariprofundaceae bacterium]
MMDDISPLIKRVARGKHGSEHLSQDEAKFIFSRLLQPDADLLQLGAFLIAQRMKGETSAELAGFVQAAHAHIAHFSQHTAPIHAVDLPCYAGKRRATHAYLIAALQARDQGLPIVVHGVQDIAGRVTAWQVLQHAGIASASNLADAQAIVQKDGMVYLDLADFCPDLNRIYHLRSRLGVRSFANTVARLLNPLQCQGQLNGFFHTPYAEYMAKANVLLGQQRSLIFMGAEGEPELYADRQRVVNKQQGSNIESLSFKDSAQSIYPKKAVATLATIHDDFQRLLDQPAQGREAATIQRMLAALIWAAAKSEDIPQSA